MKYELISNLKWFNFPCEATKNFSVNYNHCKQCKATGDWRSCWEKYARAGLAMDCAIENEQNAEEYAVCPNCGSDDIIGTAFNGYMCASCGVGFALTPDEQKAIMGDDYLEIDEAELNAEFAKIKA